MPRLGGGSYSRSMYREAKTLQGWPKTIRGRGALARFAFRDAGEAFEVAGVREPWDRAAR